MNFEKPKNQNFEKMKKEYWIYHHLRNVYQKPQSGVQPLRYRVTQFFVSFRVIFDPPLPNTAENQNFEKKKKGSGDVIILNLCNKKHNQMLYAYSDMECDRHNFLSFRLFFALLPHY